MTEFPAAPVDGQESDDDMRDLMDSIAQSLSALSDESDVPVGCEPPSEQISPNDVCFTSSAWLLSVSQIQGWLYLNDSLDRQLLLADPAAAARHLFASMNCPTPVSCFLVEGGNVRLTLLGAEHLYQRLTTAEKLKHLFQELLEDHSRREATSAWQQAWDDEDSSAGTDASSEQIKARTETWPICEFVSNASSGRLNLTPSYQRGDVWPTRDAQKLIESVLRGIPLPSIIILRPKSMDASAQYEVVDGKQRLTALLRFIGQHPNAIRLVDEKHRQFPDLNLPHHFHNNYRKFKSLWKAHVGEPLTAEVERNCYFPFALGRDPDIFRDQLACCAGKYYCELRQHTIAIGGDVETIERVFGGMVVYRIPVIEYTDATARQIHTVFHIYNQQGKHLNAEELRNAVYHDLHLARVLLATSGDNTQYEEVADFIDASLHDTMRCVADALCDYRFGTQRFRRTKVLSWVVSLLMQPAIENGELVTRSTARHIKDLFDTIKDSAGTHALCDPRRLGTLVADLAATIEAHSGFDGWDNRFKDNDTGAKWQELQLVASLVATFLLQISTGCASSLLDGKRDELLRFTAQHLRPTKTQTKQQWGFIGCCVVGILGVLGLADDVVEQSMQEKYRVSPMASLRAAAASYRA